MVSRIAMRAQSSAPVSAGVPLARRRFQATRQRAVQNRACSRRGANTTPHCSQFLISAIGAMLRVTTSTLLLTAGVAVLGFALTYPTLAEPAK